MCLKSKVVIGCRWSLVKPGAAIVDTHSLLLLLLLLRGSRDVYSDVMTFTVLKCLLVDGARRNLLLSHPDVHNSFTSKIEKQAAMVAKGLSYLQAYAYS